MEPRFFARFRERARSLSVSSGDRDPTGRHRRLSRWLKLSEAIASIDVVAQRFPPPFVFHVPAHGLLDAGFESFGGAPTELGFELGGIDCVTLVMARTIGHETDQPFVRRAVGS